MSKIFEALRRGQGSISEIALPMVVQESAIAPVAEAPAGSAGGVSSSNESARPHFAAHETVPPPLPVVAPADPGFRVAPLQVPQSAPILPFDQGYTAVSEQYRTIRTKILQSPLRPQVLVVSSANPQDGKTVTAINVAGALALKSPTLLIDGDLRKSSIALNLGFPAAPGLSDVLEGTARLEDALIRCEQITNLWVITAGKSRRNPTDLLGLPAWDSFCAAARKRFSYIILDSPPVDAVADFDLLLAASDAVILVARPDHTNRRLLFKGLEAIPKEKLIGIVMNGVKPWLFERKGRHYYYSYAESGGVS